ncbi:MAG: PLP-dependent aminotransferase family protein [Cellulosilyticum sp.]|nr:PLP-dependent aminotransferase family protein [Cellulosilyticum sp.]
MPVNSFEHYPMSWKPKLENTHTPIYICLANQLKEDIITGKLTPGTKLPPQRELADYLDINLSTVTRAFKLCEQNGLICSAVGRGTYVASDAASQNLILLNSPEKEIIEMGAILPNPDINELASNYLRQMSTEPDFYKLLQYGSIYYDELQIKAACKWFNYSGLQSSKSHIIYANGSQNGIFATMASLFQKGERIATMPTTYPGLKTVAKILGIQLQPLPLFDGKVTLQSLEYVYKNHNVKGFYFIPDFNNPTSEIMDLDTRKTIAHFCNTYKLPVIEDAIYTLFMPNPLPPIASFTPDYGIFISSVSKIMSPGLRLALLHVPTQFYKPIWECLYAMHITSPALMTQLFTRLVISGNFDEIRSLRIAELKERNQLFDNMCSELSTIGHLHSPIRWVLLPDNITPAAFEKKAYEQGLQVYSADRFIVGNTQIPHAVRLSLISTPLESFKKGLDILKTFIFSINPLST